MSYVPPKNRGFIEVICGPMFSGKTEELIRRLRRSMYAKQNIEIYKPKIDKRYSELEIVSHSSQSLVAKPINDADEILDIYSKNVQVIGIDEAQFFNSNIVNVAQELADRGIRIIIAGLDMDYSGIPFETLANLLAVAEFITKSSAICMNCGNPASRTQRLQKKSERVILGASEIYEARCRHCHKLNSTLPTKQKKYFHLILKNSIYI